MVAEVNSKNQFAMRRFKRNEKLADYFFGLSKIMCSGVVIGGLSPLYYRCEMALTNYACIGSGIIAAAEIAMFANKLLKVELKKKFILR